MKCDQCKLSIVCDRKHDVLYEGCSDFVDAGVVPSDYLIVFGTVALMLLIGLGIWKLVELVSSLF